MTYEAVATSLMIGALLGWGFALLGLSFVLIAWYKRQPVSSGETRQNSLQVRIWLRLAAILILVGVFLIAFNQSK